MPHPTNGFAFNEHSLECCNSRVRLELLFELLDEARAWYLHEAKPLVREIKNHPEFRSALATLDKDKAELLLISAVNRESEYGAASPKLSMASRSAKGATVAFQRNSFLVAWPCGCERWQPDESAWDSEPSSPSARCRNCSSVDQLRRHWVAATSIAVRLKGAPKSILRVDKMKTSTGERPHAHFRDGNAVSIDGAWKHGGRPLSPKEEEWLRSVGWVTPVDVARPKVPFAKPS